MVMMRLPECYIRELYGKSYKELIKEKNRLIGEIKKFERDHDESGNRRKNVQEIVEIITDPAPEICYKMNLKYLGKLCELISETYNSEMMH